MSNVLIELLTNIWYIGDWYPSRYSTYNQYMKDFEQRMSHWYPLGDDTFRIDHGDNYFSFFRRMGEPFYYAIFQEQEQEQKQKYVVIGTVCYVYRKYDDTGDCVM